MAHNPCTAGCLLTVLEVRGPVFTPIAYRNPLHLKNSCRPPADDNRPHLCSPRLHTLRDGLPHSGMSTNHEETHSPSLLQDTCHLGKDLPELPHQGILVPAPVPEGEVREDDVAGIRWQGDVECVPLQSRDLLVCDTARCEGTADVLCGNLSSLPRYVQGVRHRSSSHRSFDGQRPHPAKRVEEHFTACHTSTCNQECCYGWSQPHQSQRLVCLCQVPSSLGRKRAHQLGGLRGLPSPLRIQGEACGEGAIEEKGHHLLLVALEGHSPLRVACGDTLGSALHKVECTAREERGRVTAMDARDTE
eukprot:Sspe_Gene.78206::Locus_48913_Transcript_1_1_Confidence_1.000_Length_3101::g.78206::m.78206